MRIEIVAQPFAGFGVVLVVRISERFEHFGVALWAADVLGRAAAGRLDNTRIDDVGFGGAMRSTLIVCSEPSP